ncbi:hypothetical protein ACIOHC_36155 [Streptomyces sp. NPDC088252]|uniref:hypothetical protein n=1 Tax=Streptomyces sp. NPDC088252 TaxID=3365845 RepID=UPI00382B0482
MASERSLEEVTAMVETLLATAVAKGAHVHSGPTCLSGHCAAPERMPEEQVLSAQVLAVLRGGGSQAEQAAAIVQMVEQKHHCQSCDGHSCPDLGTNVEVIHPA